MWPRPTAVESTALTSPNGRDLASGGDLSCVPHPTAVALYAEIFPLGRGLECCNIPLNRFLVCCGVV